LYRHWGSVQAVRLVGFFMTTALEGGEGSASRPGPSLPSGKTRYPLYRRLGGPQGRSGQVRKISPPTGIRSPDRPARSQLLYRLRYPAHSPFSIKDFLSWSLRSTFCIHTYICLYDVTGSFLIHVRPPESKIAGFLVAFASVTALELAQFTLKYRRFLSLGVKVVGASELSVAPTFKMLLHTAVTVNGFVLRDAFHVRPVTFHYPASVTRPEYSEWYVSAVLLP
jgi:hypothetical protein